MSDDFGLFYASSFKRIAVAIGAFCGDADVAHESTQEAFARAYSRWSRVSKTSFPEAWVATTALNLSKRHFKRRGRETGLTGEVPVGGPSGDRLDVLAALRSLPERQRQAIVLHYLTDTPINGVAEAMGLSDGAVKAHLHKARAALKEPLGVRHV